MSASADASFPERDACDGKDDDAACDYDCAGGSGGVGEPAPGCSGIDPLQVCGRCEVGGSCAERSQASGVDCSLDAEEACEAADCEWIRQCVEVETCAVQPERSLCVCMSSSASGSSSWLAASALAFVFAIAVFARRR